MCVTPCISQSGPLGGFRGRIEAQKETAVVETPS